MGNKDESTNLIGRKGSKMTMKRIQKRFLHTPEQTLEEKAKNWKWTPGK